MKRFAIFVFSLFALLVANLSALAQPIGYHMPVTDDDGMLLPWFDPDPATSYDHVLRILFSWWSSGINPITGDPWYMAHQKWNTIDGVPEPEPTDAGIAGDQFAMAISSWSLFYDYTGDRTVLDNIVRIADYYINHSLSPPSATWGNLPYPYNVHGDDPPVIYDGDMVQGEGVLQPDKAGSFGAELIVLYKKLETQRYLTTAIGIADRLARLIGPGDADNSPWPFRVNAITGEVIDPYTTNFTGALRLFDGLIALGQGDVAAYTTAASTLSAWLRDSAYSPIQTQRWGPFFEDVPIYSDTETNADTLAWHILEHPQWDSNWQRDARSILDATEDQFGDDGTYSRYGVLVIMEQTAYMFMGNSHTARHSSVELVYSEKTNDNTKKPQAIRSLNWATYWVDDDGKNLYPNGEIWYSDGYGDYARHFLRAMAAAPELSPRNQDHLLQTSSVIQTVTYGIQSIGYTTFDRAARELLRVTFRPGAVVAGGVPLNRLSTRSELEVREGYTFEAPGDVEGVLRIRHDRSGQIVISASGAGPTESKAVLSAQ